jgi:hypothetical protein
MKGTEGEVVLDQKMRWSHHYPFSFMGSPLFGRGQFAEERRI